MVSANCRTPSINDDQNHDIEVRYCSIPINANQFISIEKRITTDLVKKNLLLLVVMSEEKNNKKLVFFLSGPISSCQRTHRILFPEYSLFFISPIVFRYSISCICSVRHYLGIVRLRLTFSYVFCPLCAMISILIGSSFCIM